MKISKRSLPPRYWNLYRNIILIVLSVSFTPMILATATILEQFSVSQHEKVQAHLGELVLKHKQNIDAFLKEKLGNIRMLSRTFGYEMLSDKPFLESRLALLREEYGPVFEDLGVINEQGVQVAYAGPFYNLQEAKYADSEWFSQTLKNPYYISDVFLGLRGLPHFIIAVQTELNGQKWILRATIDFMAFNSLVENIQIGETGFAFILNRQGKCQTRVPAGFKPGRELFEEFFADTRGRNGDIHIVEKVDEAGEKHIYVASFLKGGNWLLIFRQNRADAFDDLHRVQRATVLITLFGGLVIVSTAFFLSGRVVNRMIEADQEKQMLNEQVIETGKLATIGELAAGIAHEINNPVAIMVEEAGWMEDLLDEEEFQTSQNMAEYRRALKQIHDQGGRCKEITHKLLSFARKTDSRIQRVQMNDLVEDVVALSEKRGRYSNVQIRTDLDDDLPELDVSSTEIQQVLLNLINNAMDAMEKTGGAIDISSGFENGSIQVRISDNGPGIPQANLGRVFDPFFTTKPVGKGTGLGLSICYGIIKKTGGDISVQSAIDVGTTFTIRIPYNHSGNDTSHEEVIADT